MFNKDFYVNKRNVLRSKMGSGVLLFLGTSESPVNYADNCYCYRQDSTFNYFFGLKEPDLAAIMDLDTGEDILFGNDVDIDDIIWMGPQPLLKEKAEKVGVSKTRPFADLEKYIAEAVAKKRKVHYLPPYRHQNMIRINKMLGIPFEDMRKCASLEFIKAVISMRIVKDPCEIAEIDKACDIGYAMHYTAMKMAKLGMVEQELVGVMEGIAVSQGLMTSFPTILSQHGETMHNHVHDKILTDGKLIVIDAGAESNNSYVSDNTRTIPSSGKFTQKQKDIYDIVSAANNLALSIARPGVTYAYVHQTISRLIAQGLVNLGIMKGDVDEIVAAGAHSVFMPHGLGHNMGMDVHDMEDLGEDLVGYDEDQKRSPQLGLGSLRMARKLRPGHVITDEPGIYFIPALIEKWKNENFNTQYINFPLLEKEYYDFGGIRLEDDIVITETGARILGSKRLPITTEDVEREMADNNK